MKKKLKKRKKGFRIVHLLLLCLLVYSLVVFSHQRRMMKDLATKKINIETEISGLERDIDALNEEIGKSGTLEFIEKVAREDLGMVKPREIIYIDKRKQNYSLFDKDKSDN
ncbi:MAG: septum formation initiator family protein [Gudongella sp.]|nr:septum formation initiator family protein [Gudongella sp.]